MRRKVIAGNWKMNKNIQETETYINELKELVRDTQNEVIICVPFVDLCKAVKMTKDTNIKVGAQNVYSKEDGAYTGEVSAKMLADMGVEYVIIGHSERREYFNENDEMINSKLKIAIEYGLKPILCVGETLKQREEGLTKEWITKQVDSDLANLSKENVKNIIIAYEPIWAIGTGKTASKEEANEALIWIREEIENLYDKELADEIIIQYGGSVKSSNAKELFSMSDIDGGLVGGASLNPTEFAKIVNY